ncbi:MAG: tripartite tricarboxylate transporter TctB family protein [Deltaproteobacteria bacterium]|nr:tripartite tricarboxylate transporter TctB family protein [Deltaproteobacteria bacterium]
MKSIYQLILNFLVVVFFGVCLWQATGWPMQAKFFPLTILIPMLGVGFLNAAYELRSLCGKKHLFNGSARAVQFSQPDDERHPLRRTIAAFSWIIGFFGGIWLLGFSVSIPLFLFLYIKVYSGEGWALSLTLACAAWLLYFGLFDRLLHLPFPDGMIFSLIG